MKNSPMPPRSTPFERNTDLKRGPFDPKRSPWGSKKSKAQQERDRERKAQEFARKYGSLERVFFVQVIIGCRINPGQRAENAHIEREGMGRKAHHSKIVGLSKPYHTGLLGLDTIGRERFEQLHGIDLELLARRTDEIWRRHGPRAIAQAKADGTYDAWLNERRNS